MAAMLLMIGGAACAQQPEKQENKAEVEAPAKAEEPKQESVPETKKCDGTNEGKECEKSDAAASGSEAASTENTGKSE